MKEQFKKDVLEGLSRAPMKTLPSKYFYDKKGDELFVKIMALPEYYLTRAEMDIFENKTDELINSLALQKGKKYELIELGAGDGTKTIHLLRELINQGYQFEYYPVDISKNALDGLKQMLRKELPGLSVKPQQGDYFIKLEQLHHNNTAKVVLCLGSNIGNLSDDQATKFIYKLGSNLFPGDKIVLGVDMIKQEAIVLPAYSDAGGVTAEFNLNLLNRINRELGGNFVTQNFKHTASYRVDEGVAKSYLVSKIDQVVTIDGYTFQFLEGEKIRTEISRKYSDEIIKCILKETDITWEHKITDSKNLFADYILVRH